MIFRNAKGYWLESRTHKGKLCSSACIPVISSTDMESTIPDFITTSTRGLSLVAGIPPPVLPGYGRSMREDVPYSFFGGRPQVITFNLTFLALFMSIYF